MKKQIFCWLLLGLVVAIGCQKEISFQIADEPAQGSLKTAAGDCSPKTISGVYKVGTALVPDTNTITVDVNVTQTGNYTITTDTVNGFSFKATGVFTSSGTNTVKLKGNGTPFAAGTFNFVVSFDSTSCNIQIVVVPVGTVPAVFTLQGAPNACTGATVAGTYAVGTALGATNTATINVTVTTLGTYTITSTATNGMTFSKTGVFTILGSQAVILVGTGIPTTGGINTIPVTVGTSTCTFPVNVSNVGVGSLGGGPGTCTPSTVNGTYTAGTALVASNTVQLQVTVTTPGVCTIKTDTIAGFSFSFVGTLAAGTQNVILIGTGNPTSAGAKSFNVNFGTSICNFVVNVGAAVPGAGTLGGGPGACTPATVNGTYTSGTALVAANTVQVQVTVTTPGVCTISTNTVAGFSFAFSANLAAGTQNVILIGTGNPTSAGAKSFTVTFGTSTCTFVVNVVAGGPGAGTLGGGPGACTPATVNGTYTVGTALVAANTVQVQVTVTTPGVCTISTNTVAGFSFAFSATLAAGTQNVLLVGTGNPTSSGAKSFTVTFGTSTCTFIVNVQAAAVIDYFPRTTNSNWSYEFDDIADDSLIIYVVPNTIIVNSNVYNTFMEDDGFTLDTSGYYRKSGNDYFQWLDLSTLGFDNPVWAEINFLKDNQAASFSWTTAGYSGTVSGSPITIRFRYTVLQQNVSISVASSTGNVTYPNTIVLKEEIEQFVGGNWISLTSSIGHNENYYSRNVGLIQQYYYDGSGVLSQTFEIRRYQVF